MPVLATALALRLALLRGALRHGPGSTGRQLGFVGGAMASGLLAVGAFAVLAGARGPGSVPVDLATLLFTAMLAGLVLLPLLTFGSDDLLDPTRLALLPLSGRQLVTVLGAGGLVGVAPVATAIAALGLLPATGRGAASYVVALLAVVLQLLLCVGLSRACAAALSGLLRSRRGRDLGVVLAALLIIGIQAGNLLLQRGASGGLLDAALLHRLVEPLRWTPTGLLAAAPARPLPLAALSLLGVAALSWAVLRWWQRSIRRARWSDRTAAAVAGAAGPRSHPGCSPGCSPPVESERSPPRTCATWRVSLAGSSLC